MSKPVPVPVDRQRLLIWLALCLVIGFLLTSLASYYTSKRSIRSAIVDTELPLTADNIYSEIQRDLVQPVLISSLMANDSFVRQWVLHGENDAATMTRYLAEIKREYHTVTAFFISDKTYKYYHADGKHRDVRADRPSDNWYFRVRDLNAPYEVNVDFDESNQRAMTVFINYRVLDFNGQFIGVTGVGLTVAQMDKRIRDYQQKYEREIFFANESGQIVLSSSPRFQRERFVQEFPVLASWAIAKDGGVTDTRQYNDGDEVHLMSARYIPDLHWTIYVDKAETTALMSIQRTLSLNILISFGVTLLVLWWVQRIVGHYQQRLEILAVTDPLTNFHNRLGFNLLMQQLSADMQREPRPACALMIDVDHFKAINDEHGHLLGDQVLRHVAEQIRAQVRASDMVCRWGGEEFLVLARDCLRDDAQHLAEKIRHAVREHPFPLAKGDILRVTISIGVSEWQRDETATGFFHRADHALYQAKRSGRDQVVMATAAQ